jgi:hypothetical protein
MKQVTKISEQIWDSGIKKTYQQRSVLCGDGGENLACGFIVLCSFVVLRRTLFCALLCRISEPPSSHPHY